MINSFILFVGMVGFSSCSTIVYKSKNRIPLNFESKKNETEELIVTGSKEFYLGGFVPKYHEVYVDEEVLAKGGDSISKLSIEDHLTFKNYIVAILTLGFYTPRTYTIKGYTKKHSN